MKFSLLLQEGFRIAVKRRKPGTTWDDLTVYRLDREHLSSFASTKTSVNYGDSFGFGIKERMRFDEHIHEALLEGATVFIYK